MFLKISEIHRKASALKKSPFNKISRLCLGQVFSCEFCKTFKTTLKVTFQSSLRFQTGLSSFRVSCKRALTGHLWATVSDVEPLDDCFWCTSSVEVTGSNQGFTVLIDVIIRLYNPLVKVFQHCVKNWYLFCKTHIWCSVNSKDNIWRLWHHQVQLFVL